MEDLMRSHFFDVTISNPDDRKRVRAAVEEVLPRVPRPQSFVIEDDGANWIVKRAKPTEPTWPVPIHYQFEDGLEQFKIALEDILCGKQPAIVRIRYHVSEVQ
jgi:hypothetical protein